MENNCLVTVYKGKTNNPNLPVYGALNFSINGLANYTIMLGQTAVGDCKFTTINSQLYKDYSIPVGSGTGLTKLNITEPVDCVLTDCFNLRSWNINNNLKNFDISQFLECPNIDFICMEVQQNSSCTGDVKKFLNDFAALYPDRQATMKITTSGGGFTNIPTGVGNRWNNLGEVFFNSSYTNGWYIKASDGTYYDSNGNVITP